MHRPIAVIWVHRVSEKKKNRIDFIILLLHHKFTFRYILTIYFGRCVLLLLKFHFQCWLNHFILLLMITSVVILVQFSLPEFQNYDYKLVWLFVSFSCCSDGNQFSDQNCPSCMCENALNGPAYFIQFSIIIKFLRAKCLYCSIDHILMLLGRISSIKEFVSCFSGEYAICIKFHRVRVCLKKWRQKQTRTHKFTFFCLVWIRRQYWTEWMEKEIMSTANAKNIKQLNEEHDTCRRYYEWNWMNIITTPSSPSHSPGWRCLSLYVQFVFFLSLVWWAVNRHTNTKLKLV